MARHIDYKATVWNRITVPDNVTDEQVLALFERHAEPYEVVEGLRELSKTDPTWKTLTDTEEFMHPVENDNQETMALLDNDGNTVWSNSTTKEEMIRQIKALVEKNDDTISTAELEHPYSPVYKSIQKDSVCLIENINADDVTVRQYVHDTETDEFYVDYEELEYELVAEILELVKQYDVEQEKTMDRARG